MQIGLAVPVMVPGLDRDGLYRWCRAIDEGPFSSLAAGERYLFPNPELTVTLAMAAAWTERVSLLFHSLVLTLHPPVVVAKQIASLDALSGGRVRVALAAHARGEDFRALGQSIDGDGDGDGVATLHERVDRMRRLWAGEPAYEGAPRPLEPRPMRPGGPELLAAAAQPRSIRRAAQWADGICGLSLALDEEALRAQFEMARAAWHEAGRATAPRLVASGCFALGPDPRAQMDAWLARYADPAGDGAPGAVAAPAAAVAPVAPVVAMAAGPAALRAALRRAEDAGAEELVLVPTTSDPAEVQRLLDAIA